MDVYPDSHSEFVPIHDVHPFSRRALLHLYGAGDDASGRAMYFYNLLFK